MAEDRGGFIMTSHERITINTKIDEALKTAAELPNMSEICLSAEEFEATVAKAAAQLVDELRADVLPDARRHRSASVETLVVFVVAGLGLAAAAAPRKAISAKALRELLKNRKLGGCGTLPLSKALVGRLLLVAEHWGLVSFASTRPAKKEEPGGIVRHHHPYLTEKGVIHYNAALQAVAELEFDNPQSWGKPLPLPAAKVPHNKNFAEKGAAKNSAQTTPPMPPPAEPVSPRAAFVLGSGDPLLSGAKKIGARTADGTEYVFSCAKDAAEFERLRREG